MNENNGQRFTGLITLALLLGTGIWAIVASRGRLDSDRPAEAIVSKRDTTVRVQDVPARLWQDPFEALETLTNGAVVSVVAAADNPNNLSATNPAVANTKNDRTVIKESLHSRDFPKMILAVMLEGETYSESAEVRRRMRYAVEMALLSSGFAPDDRNRIGAERVCAGPDGKECYEMAFEWFSHAQDANILVLWLKEEDYSGAPLKSLGRMLAAIGNHTSFFLIGPRSSDTLRAMALDRGSEISAEFSFPCFRVYSPEATAPDNLLIPRATGSGTPEREAIGELIFSNVFKTNLCFRSPQIDDQPSLLQQLATGSDERSRALRERFDVADLTVEKLPAFLNQILFSTNNLAASAAFTNDLPIDILSFAKRRFPSNCYARINRLLLEHAYPGLHPRDGLTNDVVRNWIALDDALCTNLVRELQARGVATSTSTHDVIAFVSEADSFYGRSLPKAFGVALTNSWGGNATNGKTPVLLFGYLRGLDGSKPKPNIETPKRDNLAPTPENFLLEGLARQTENAEGESQTDYGQRLAQQLRAKYDEARLAGGHMAVGLAGNDVYDKLLLLRALKFKLPEAVFFTTDLDARMWMPRSRLHYTRNLIVASAQPVTDEHREVGGSDERDSMPAFRDVYQTTIYRACRAAIADRFAERPLTNEPRDPNDLAGKIFEIGRSGPVILSDPAPYPQFRLWWLLPAGIAALYLLMTILIAHLDMARIRWFWIIWPVLHVLLLAGFIWYAQCVAARAGEEPWAPDSGTSIWSTEIIRVGLIALACQMLSLVFIQHRQLRNFLWKRFFADTRSPRPVGGPISATEVFEHYCIRGKTRWRLARAGGLTFAYFGAVALISYAAGQIPQRLCIRGSTSRNLDLWVLLLAVCITLLILFLALDASQLTTQMLSQLAGRATKWPRRVLRDFAKDKLVAPGHLSGWLDVHFAAVKTTSTRNFISMPFILIFLLILSRLPYFENWTWPPLLIAVFAINFGLTLLCWAMVRGSAATLRKEAAARLATIADRFANVKGPIRVAGPGFRYASTGPEYSRRLRKLIEEINEQRDGAYARWFQDPTFVALLIPTGATGVIAVLLQYWLTHS